ncbi:hypothetical protein MRX96_030775 [Rhipicephalus microplus]
MAPQPGQLGLVKRDFGDEYLIARLPPIRRAITLGVEGRLCASCNGHSAACQDGRRLSSMCLGRPRDKGDPACVGGPSGGGTKVDCSRLSLTQRAPIESTPKQRRHLGLFGAAVSGPRCDRRSAL